MPENIETTISCQVQLAGDDVDSVVKGIRSISGESTPVVDKNRMNGSELAYATWVKDQTPENMSGVLASLAPTINSEVTRYAGPQTLLRSRAKVLAVKAVKTFNPMSGTKLTSWVVNGLKPLARYSTKQRDISIPEVAARQAAAVNASARKLSDELGRDPTDEELADDVGISVKRVRDVRRKAVASVTSGAFDEIEGDEGASSLPGVVTPSKVPFAEEAVYQDLSDTDKMIFDAATGSHGSKKIPAIDIARRLGVSPAAVSQRARLIGEQIAYVVNNA